MPISACHEDRSLWMVCGVNRLIHGFRTTDVVLVDRECVCKAIAEFVLEPLHHSIGY